MFYVGIDIAKQNHEASIIDLDGSIPHRPGASGMRRKPRPPSGPVRCRRRSMRTIARTPDTPARWRRLPRLSLIHIYAILSIIELEAEINEDICKLVQTKKDIVHKIKAVQNTEYQTLLELRYLCFKSWEQIAVDMGYELRWLYRLHHRALDAVTEISH